MLALLLFLKRLIEYTQFHDSWTGTVATDSQSLIYTVRGTRRDSPSPATATAYRRPLDPLSPEWDITVGIRALLNAMPGLTLQHIKGH